MVFVNAVGARGRRAAVRRRQALRLRPRARPLRRRRVRQQEADPPRRLTVHRTTVERRGGEDGTSPPSVVRRRAVRPSPGRSAAASPKHARAPATGLGTDLLAPPGRQRHPGRHVALDVAEGVVWGGRRHGCSVSARRGRAHVAGPRRCRGSREVGSGVHSGRGWGSHRTGVGNPPGPRFGRAVPRPVPAVTRRRVPRPVLRSRRRRRCPRASAGALTGPSPVEPPVRRSVTTPTHSSEPGHDAPGRGSLSPRPRGGEMEITTSQRISGRATNGTDAACRRVQRARGPRRRRPDDGDRRRGASATPTSTSTTCRCGSSRPCSSPSSSSA